MSTVCKLLLIITLIGFSYYLFAKGGRYFRSTGSNYRNTNPLITKETWKPIVAGGAAAADPAGHQHQQQGFYNDKRQGTAAHSRAAAWSGCSHDPLSGKSDSDPQ